MSFLDTWTTESAVRAIAVAIQTPSVGNEVLGVPMLLWGPPGVGKTAFAKKIANALGYHFVTVLASIRTPDDFLGIPIPNQKTSRVTYYAPDWAIDLNENSDNPDPKKGHALGTNGIDGRPGRKALLFLDEFSTATPAVQSALLRVVHERVVGDLQLNSNVAVIAAANPPYMSPGAEGLEPPTVNRFIHVGWPPIPKNMWADYITGNPQAGVENLPYVSPVQFALRFPQVAEGGAAFIKAMSASALEKAGVAVAYQQDAQYVPLFNMPDYNEFSSMVEGTDFEPAMMAWPSPRSWEIALRVQAGCVAAGADDIVKMVVCGSIGAPLCNKYESYLSNNTFALPEEYLAGTARLPKDTARLHPIALGVIRFGLMHPQTLPAVVEWFKANSERKIKDGIPMDVIQGFVSPEITAWIGSAEGQAALVADPSLQHTLGDLGAFMAAWMQSAATAGAVRAPRSQRGAARS